MRLGPRPAGRCPARGKRSHGGPADTPEVDDLVAAVAATDESVDRMTARRNLAGIDFVGVTDDLTSLAAEMAQCFNVPLIDVPRLNRSEPFDIQLTDAVRRRLENRNALDQELYELARAQQQVRRGPDQIVTGRYGAVPAES
jgi:hypothetical protein